MESGRTIEIPIDPIKHDFYIYYNKVGIIQGIYKELQNSKFDYVVTKNQDAGKIISGHLNKNLFCVNYNTDNDTVEFMHKKHAGNLSPLEDILFQIPLDHNSITSDVTIDLYPNNNILSMDISQQTKKRLTWGINVYDLKNPQGSELNVYITKKDNPDHLIMQIVIDPMDLLTHERVIVEMPGELTRYVDYNDISIWTRRMFNTYSYRLIDNYIDFNPKTKHRIKISENDDECHIKFVRLKEGNLFVQGVDDILKLIDKNVLTFYVVDATIERDIESRLLHTLLMSTEDIVEGLEFTDVILPEKFKVLHEYNLKIGQT
tara:strand:- start:22991 stop:23944 length:954 start_codon:yes stop_codon:yes gene_type:complete